MSKAITIDPANGETVNEYERIDIFKAKEKIAFASEVYTSWKQTTFTERSQLMHALAKLFLERKEEYAQLATLEVGKTIIQASKEIEKCAWICRFYGDNTERLLAKEIVETEEVKSYVTFQPMGVILAVMPWNFPFYQVIRFAAPAIMAGNTGVLKHASNVQGSAYALEDAFVKAGFSKGVFTNLNMSAD
ncbi:aldehyde dehydrogenase family protein [Pedobacter petrophilus]|uniref:aldehyde dehydrogenase family protein n=1 Tax=Pedobacter petrophilus TaxID=1908241 RepID=UPI001ADFBDFD|nr:aldehyde dehydrogenase family protein [Pedobacter petrophilus]